MNEIKGGMPFLLQQIKRKLKLKFHIITICIRTVCRIVQDGHVELLERKVLGIKIE